MSQQKSWRGSAMLILTALIWGIAFVAQSEGMNYVGTFTFNACRFLVGGIVLIPCMFILRKKHGNIVPANRDDRRRVLTSMKGGICCGTCLFLAGTLQQSGIAYTTAGKAGFITSLYIIIVPLLGLLIHKKAGKNIWISVLVAAAGMYLLCMEEGFVIGKGDFLVFLCAIGFSLHILIIDYFSPKADAVLISCIQFFTAGILSSAAMFVLEQPAWDNIVSAGIPILYAGVLSCGVAYTLQVVAQKHVEPVVASLLMSLESVFSLLAGLVLLSQVPSVKEALGCLLVFAAILLAQIPVEWLRKSILWEHSGRKPQL
ncbi:MAG: DMT family transporter [Lachnospiraceae bacterium]